MKESIAQIGQNQIGECNDTTLSTHFRGANLSFLSQKNFFSFKIPHCQHSYKVKLLAINFFNRFYIFEMLIYFKPLAMIKGNFVLSALILVLVLFSCKKDEFDKYERPNWLAGKVYSQIQTNDSLKTFAKCLQLTGYDSIINISGSYTVFAPTDEAFQAYFNSNSKNYKSVEDIPLTQLTELVKYHIVQNAWSRQQLRSLDVNGWIDRDDDYNNKPRGYKRETLLLKDNNKFGIKATDNKSVIIVDTTQSSWHRIVATDSRKLAPIFYSEYFQIYNLSLSDYSFYFDRSFDNSDDMFYVNAKIVGDEIFAENGFVYKVDRVVEPLPNANEILRSKSNSVSYSKFLDLVNQFSTFTYNKDKTFDQAGASQGLQVDSLFDLTFTNLTFDITSEKTKAPASGTGLPSEVSIRFHHGLIAPTNEAFDAFIQQYVEGSNQWGSLDNMPQKIKRIIANTYFSQNPIYETDIQNGFYNGEADILRLNTEDIVQKVYGSNCTFIGVNKAVVPRAFKSITGPIYRQKNYSTMMNAIEYSGLLSALKREGSGNMLFAVPDPKLRADSSLFYNPVSESFNAVMLYPTLKNYYFNQNDIRLLLLNQIAVESPNGSARKEFLKTLAGNHIIWNNVDGTVKGTSSSTFGYNGSTSVTLKPTRISEDTDNGNTYSVDAWFRFTNESIFQKIKTSFPAFHALLVKAGYALTKEYRYSFLSENKLYTIFAPSDKALQDIKADTLTGVNLQNFLKLHFIQDEMVFTDGRMSSGYYKTTCEIPVSSGSNRTKSAEIYIGTGTDKITIRNKSNGDYLVVDESTTSNSITSRSLSDTESNFPNIMSTGVIHQIDKAFMLDLLDIK